MVTGYLYEKRIRSEFYLTSILANLCRICSFAKTSHASLLTLSHSLYCAEGASFSTALGFQTASACLHVCPSGFWVIFAKRICAGFTPFSRSWHFNLDFRGSRKFMKKLRNRTSGIDPAGPRFWTLFCHFFREKFRFSLEG